MHFNNFMLITKFLKLVYEFTCECIRACVCAYNVQVYVCV